MIYAQLDENKICVGMHDMAEFNHPDYILVDDFDTTLMGKKYENGNWIEVPKEEVPVEPTQLDRIEEKINQNYEQAQQSAVDSYTMELMESGIL